MFLMMSILVHGEKVAVIDEVLKPTSLVVDDEQLYINEDTTIFIYSLNDYKFKKKFGQAGEGPKEFLQFAIVNSLTDHLLINSFGKISFFTKDGSYIREVKTKGIGWLFSPLGDGYIGFARIGEDNIAYNTINFYDAELNRGKEIARSRVGNLEKGIEVLKKQLYFNIHDNKIFLVGSDEFVIDVFDHTGEKLYSITQEYERIKFDPKIEEQARESIKRQNPAQYEFIKNKLNFPDYFTAISFFFIDNNKLYVGTFNLQRDKLEFYIFDLKGKLLKKQFVTFAFIEGTLQPYPLNFKNGKLYQLIENEDEEWELHISKFD